MTAKWKRLSANVWWLDDRWLVVEEMPYSWRVYRSGERCLAEFCRVQDALDEAEKLRKADGLYA